MARRLPIGVRSNVPHFVYRCYDADDRLLYVGCTNAPRARVAVHLETAWWAGDVTRVRYTVFPDREKALSIEREAIWAEKPLCNVKGRWHKLDDRTDWSAQDYLDYHHAILQTATILDGAHTARLLKQVEAELGARYSVTPLTPQPSVAQDSSP